MELVKRSVGNEREIDGSLQISFTEPTVEFTTSSQIQSVQPDVKYSAPASQIQSVEPIVKNALRIEGKTDGLASFKEKIPTMQADTSIRKKSNGFVCESLCSTAVPQSSTQALQVETSATSVQLPISTIGPQGGEKFLQPLASKPAARGDGQFFEGPMSGRGPSVPIKFEATTSSLLKMETTQTPQLVSTSHPGVQYSGSASSIGISMSPAIQTPSLASKSQVGSADKLKASQGSFGTGMSPAVQIQKLASTSQLGSADKLKLPRSSTGIGMSAALQAPQLASASNLDSVDKLKVPQSSISIGMSPAAQTLQFDKPKAPQSSIGIGVSPPPQTLDLASTSQPGIQHLGSAGRVKAPQRNIGIGLSPTPQLPSTSHLGVQYSGSIEKPKAPDSKFGVGVPATVQTQPLASTSQLRVQPSSSVDKLRIPQSSVGVGMSLPVQTAGLDKMQVPHSSIGISISPSEPTPQTLRLITDSVRTVPAPGKNGK